MGTQAVVTSVEQNGTTVPKGMAVPKMGILPEVDGENELPSSALSFLDSF